MSSNNIGWLSDLMFTTHHFCDIFKAGTYIFVDFKNVFCELIAYSFFMEIVMTNPHIIANV